ncbi:MAG TPA: hypothetical protein PLU87_15065 [Sedimentisphaerales bacterium]|nr:hypothetical protein [Sedimentisphaerales bacterium]HRS12470.1 hypothetical protein [Sedimentisphaerales bacterium]HRV49087.1 hypothetical protein [Sedimentisphaerales bacterium]
MNHRMHTCRLIAALGLSLLTSSVARGTSLQLRFERAASGYGVSVLLDGRAMLTSPAEGLWSIATDWRDGWPADWVHAGPTEMERAGDWTILRGALRTASGTWQLRDAYRVEGNIIKCVRRFMWQGPQTAKQTTLSVRFQCPGRGAGVLLPGILYYGNPSGRRSGRVPVYEGRPGDLAFFEEHRFPMPYVSIEWPDQAGRCGAALHSVPSPVPFGHRPDQWWSLGLAAHEDGTELALLSGPCASNGRKSVIKATQDGFIPYDDACLDVPSGAIIEKTFYLQVYDVDSEGSGFQHPTRTSLHLFAPFSTDGMPTFREIVRSKHRFAKTRWYETETEAGFKKYPDRNFFVLGWCGQAAACGYALTALADELNDPNALLLAQKSLDFISTTEFHDQGFCTWYSCDEKRWLHRDNPELLSQGQAMLNVANALRVGKSKGLDVTRWETFLRRACDFHARRILSEAWRPVSTNDAFFIAPLCQAWRLFQVEEYREAAAKAGRVYASRHLSMREPYWGGTLDASCEDKEGAFAALQGFLALYDLTGEPAYLTWAAHAGDVVLTYVVVWDIDLPPGRLRDHNFKTRGWTAVSVQNQHIDVFGVLIAPDIYRLGQHLGRDDLKKTALLMYRSCGQLIDPFGSQGEQPHHTNYAQHGEFRKQLEAGNIAGVRGNYVEQWTVFWITAHFLNAAAQFKELGVSIR